MKTDNYPPATLTAATEAVAAQRLTRRQQRAQLLIEVADQGILVTQKRASELQAQADVALKRLAELKEAKTRLLVNGNVAAYAAVYYSDSKDHHTEHNRSAFIQNYGADEEIEADTKQVA